MASTTGGNVSSGGVGVNGAAGTARAGASNGGNASSGGNANGGGAAVRWEIAPKLGVELETDVRRAEITALAIAVSLVYDLPSIGRVVPYAAAGVGGPGG